MKDVEVNIHDMPRDSPAYLGGNLYGYDVIGSTFGRAGPAKSRSEIVEGIRDYIHREEEWHGERIRIREFRNDTDLDITIADFKGEEKLTKWF